MYAAMLVKPGLSALDRGAVEDAVVDALDSQYPGWGSVTGGGGLLDGSASDISFELVESVDSGDVARVIGEAAVRLLEDVGAEFGPWRVEVAVGDEDEWSNADG